MPPLKNHPELISLKKKIEWSTEITGCSFTDFDLDKENYFLVKVNK